MHVFKPITQENIQVHMLDLGYGICSYKRTQTHEDLFFRAYTCTLKLCRGLPVRNFGDVTKSDGVKFARWHRAMLERCTAYMHSHTSVVLNPLKCPF